MSADVEPGAKVRVPGCDLVVAPEKRRVVPRRGRYRMVRDQLRNVASVFGAAGLCLGAAAQPVGGDVTVETVAVLVTDREYPGIGRVRNVMSVDVNDSCWLAARVEAVAPGTDNRREMLLAGPHAERLFVAAVGGELIRGTGLRPPALEAFRHVQIGRFGEFSYQGNMTNPQGVTANTLLRALSPTGPHFVLARVGEQAPGQPAGVTYAGFAPHAMGTDAIACVATLAGAGVTAETDAAMLTFLGGAPRLVREGVPISSIGDRTLSLPEPASAFPTVWGPATVFRAGVRAAPGETPTPSLLASAPVQIVAQAGQSAPGLAGVTFQSFRGFPSVGFGFDVAYVALLGGQSVTPANANSVWLRNFGLVARGEQRAPDLGRIVYARFGSVMVHGRERGMVFAATLAGDGVGAENGSALFAGPAGGLRLVARMGDAAPETGEGVRLGGFDVVNDETPIFVNAGGDIVFINRLRGETVTAANDLAIFVRERGESLRLVAREGATVEIDGVPRTIAELVIFGGSQPGAPGQTNGEDGRRTILNRHGECFYIARFTDGGAALMKAQAARRPCDADFNGDRFIDCFDYLDYVEAFEAGDDNADLNLDAFLDFFDYTRFVELFEAGC